MILIDRSMWLEANKITGILNILISVDNCCVDSPEIYFCYMTQNRMHKIKTLSARFRYD
jgi:hypothetical protein